MALIQANFVSKSLLRTVPIQVILPVDKFSMSGSAQKEQKPFKTLYLLHGLLGNYTDWVSGTHSWDFWDQEIKKVLDWLPLNDVNQGATSGSVGA